MSEAKAAVLEEFNAPLVLRKFPLPAALEPGAALARTEMAGICGTDVHLWKGQLPISLPVILGHETVGRLEQLGEGLEQDWTGQPLKIGDLVRGMLLLREEKATDPLSAPPRLRHRVSLQSAAASFWRIRGVSLF